MKRVLLAVSRLAGLYALGVGALFLLLAVILEGPPEPLSGLLVITIPAGITFLLAFVLLAVARRAGFAVLWLLLMALWAWFLARAPVFAIPMTFVSWTTLALPMYGLGFLGVPPAGRLRWAALGTVMLWMLLIVVPIAFRDVPPDVLPLPTGVEMLYTLVPFVWAPAPICLGVYEIVRLWVGIGRIAQVAPAA